MTCSDADECFSCIDTENMTKGESGFCECNNGFFYNPENRICQACEESCATCKGPEACETCPDFFELGETKCL